MYSTCSVDSIGSDCGIIPVFIITSILLVVQNVQFLQKKKKKKKKHKKKTTKKTKTKQQQQTDKQKKKQKHTHTHTHTQQQQQQQQQQNNRYILEFGLCNWRDTMVSYAVAPAQWLSGRASALWPGGCGFDPRPGHTKDFKNGTSCSFAWRSALRK